MLLCARSGGAAPLAFVGMGGDEGPKVITPKAMKKLKEKPKVSQLFTCFHIFLSCYI